LSDKDKEFVEVYHAERPLDLQQIVERIKATSLEPALQQQAIHFVTRLVSACQRAVAATRPRP